MKLPLDRIAILLLLVAGCGPSAAPQRPPTATSPVASTRPTSAPPSASAPTRPAPTPAPALGRVAVVRAGDIWAKDVPDGEERQLTRDGRNSQPRWSPSGTWLAFYKTDPGRKDTSAETRQELWVIRADGRDARPVDPGQAGGAHWSPVADRLAYAVRSGAVVVNADGSDRREMPGAGADAWSPDGQWLAYARSELLGTRDPASAPQRHASLWRIRADGTGATELLDGGTPSRDGFIVAGWSPDGLHVLYWVTTGFGASLLADGAALMTVPSAGGPPVELTRKMLAHRDFLAWQPVGGQLALVDGSYRAVWERKAIALAAPAGGPRRLSEPGRADVFPAWSPDGRFVAYAGAPEAPGEAGGNPARSALGQRRIWLMQPDGSGKRQLTDDPAYRDERPRWSADGSHLLFVRLWDDRQPQLWLMRSDGSQARPVADLLDARVLSSYPPEVQPTWFGYYGYVDWGRLYDWWQPRSAPPPTLAPVQEVPKPDVSAGTPMPRVYPSPSSAPAIVPTASPPPTALPGIR